MEINSQEIGAITVLSFSGKLDTLASPAAQSALTEAIAASDAGVVVDMSDVAFVSSAGLRVMLIAAKGAKAQGKVFRLAAMREGVADVFKMTGFDRLIDIRPDTASATA